MWAPLVSVAGERVPRARLAGGLRGPAGLGPARKGNKIF
jgi:hypothetical protein